jgi:hypothetical protein
MSRSCAEWRGEIGAYIVGALDDPAHAQVSRHLAECAGCRAEYDELVPIRAWLGRLALAERGMEPRRLWAVRQRAARPRRAGPRGTRPGGTRGRGTWRLLAAGSAVVGGAAFAVAVVVVGPSARSFSAVDGATGVSGHAQLHSTPVGTQIDLTASGLPAGKRCVLVAVGRDGADIAGTWDATYEGSARIAGISAVPAGQLTELRIESAAGLVLLSIRV